MNGLKYKLGNMDYKYFVLMILHDSLNEFCDMGNI